ncbi:hypothetical protein J4E93_010475 [Alternaria ventricosa]|uniref:uncharacterized protein n=1 Tax=Alternaria ventricosa TaxID=1187951 RepID=UPI0020C3EE8C|nr:uncharacterized protein J4E93_010475 [Alternaria ventricosa]KAI4638007.1 hypothetical protein J4E93_010475 [Alternaria ventricosa]
MKPQMAVSLASAVIQLVNFARKVIQKDKVGKVSKSTSTTLGEATLLDDAIANLGDLSQQLEKARRAYYKSHISPNQEIADAQLVALVKDGGGVARILQATLDQAKRDDDVDEETVLAQGLRSILSLYYSQKTICDLADKLDSIRKRVDVALLASLRSVRCHQCDHTLTQIIDSMRLNSIQFIRRKDGFRWTAIQDLIHSSSSLSRITIGKLRRRLMSLHFQTHSRTPS